MDDRIGPRVQRRGHGAMWTAIAGAALLFGALLAFGWSRGDALSAATGALLLACVGVCVWAWLSVERDWRRIPPYRRTGPRG